MDVVTTIFGLIDSFVDISQVSNGYQVLYGR